MVRANLASLSHQLEALREVVGQPITVLSGHRCRTHNDLVGGADRSKHLNGTAADVKSKGWTGSDLRIEAAHLALEGKMLEGGMGVYADKPRTLHYDTRGYPARWER